MEKLRKLKTGYVEKKHHEMSRTDYIIQLLIAALNGYTPKSITLTPKEKILLRETKNSHNDLEELVAQTYANVISLLQQKQSNQDPSFPSILLIHRYNIFLLLDSTPFYFDIAPVKGTETEASLPELSLLSWKLRLPQLSNFHGTHY